MSDRQENWRREVSAADDTGMFENEEAMAQAETLLPVEDFHAALPERHPAHATVDQLHAEVTADKPDAKTIQKHVGALRAVPQLEAIVANWWDSPATQRFIANIGQIGL
jgi:hypothetical protein